jgi:hypothetical protein
MMALPTKSQRISDESNICDLNDTKNNNKNELNPENPLLMNG